MELERKARSLKKIIVDDWPIMRYHSFSLVALYHNSENDYRIARDISYLE